VSARRGETVFAVAVVAVFLFVRLALLVVREPFFDELWTVWAARKPVGELLAALRLDSGPPLYYLIARIPNVFALRALSLLFATATLALVLTRASLGNARWIAGALLALYPPAALFAADARAYALCGLFVAIGAIAVHEERPFAAAGAFVLAAYTHWYGALFLPLILLAKARLRAVFALAGAALLFIPGLLLARVQPAEATAWLSGQHPLAAVNAFAFTGAYPESLFASPPLVVIALSCLALVLAGIRSWRFAPLAIVPLLLAIAFAFAARTVYFPMRFESVIAAPLVLWLAWSLQQWRREWRAALVAMLCLCGGFALIYGMADHQQRPPDAYREAAAVLARAAGPNDTVVASGFLYLEAVHQLGDRVRAYPAEQGSHPGWRVRGRGEAPPEGNFLWIGERAAPELAAIRRRPVRLLFANGRAVVLRVSAPPGVPGS
jgi:hypothetical protein